MTFLQTLKKHLHLPKVKIAVFSLILFVGIFVSFSFQQQQHINTSIMPERQPDKNTNTLRIAITSCAKISEQPYQPVWQAILDQQPDLLLLLGDNVYLDKKHLDKFFKHKGVSKKNYNKTIEQMAFYYQQQWQEQNFKRLIDQVPYLLMWDDHDAGVNNIKPFNGELKQITNPLYYPARQLFEQYVINFNKPELYRSLNMEHVLVNGLRSDLTQLSFHKDDTLDYAMEIKGHLFVFLDGISRRTKKQIVSEQQLNWLEQQLKNHKGSGFKFVATGAPIHFTSDDWSWDEHPDSHNALLNILNRYNDLVFLAGDKHQTALIPPIKGKTQFYEFIASGAAYSKKNNTDVRAGNFLIIDIPVDNGKLSNTLEYQFFGNDFTGGQTKVPDFHSQIKQGELTIDN